MLKTPQYHPETRQKSIQYLEKQAQKAREYFKAHLYLWIADDWKMNPVFISIKPDGSKKVEPLTDSNGKKIWIKSPDDPLGNCNAILGYNDKYVTLDIDNVSKLKLPPNFPIPQLKIKTGRGFHLRFLNGDFEKSEKLSFGELIFKNYGIFLDGSYHAPTDSFYEIIEENKTTDKLYQKDIQQFLKKPTKNNKLAPGNRNNNLNKDVFFDVAKNAGENVPKIIKMYKNAGLTDNEIQRTTQSAIQGALDKGVTFQEDTQQEKVNYTPAKTVEADIKARLEALKVKVRFNTRNQLPEIQYDKSPWLNLDDGKDKMLYSDIHQNLKCSEDKIKKISISDWNQHLKALIHRCEVDTFKQWLNGLPEWDNKKRLENVLSTLFNVTSDQKLASWTFKTVLLMAVKRTFQPGIKFDIMAVLVGKQDIGKSSLWNCLFENESWFSDSVSFSDRDKEILESAYGAVIIENAELAGTRRGEIEKIKSFITRQTDKVRWSYGRQVSVIPRNFILVGTTNEPDCLPNDSTGLRRFLPVTLDSKEDTAQQNGKKVREYIKENRKQLWAEALHLHKSKETHFMPSELYPIAQKEAEEHRFSNTALEDAVIKYLSTKSKQLEPKQILSVRMNEIIANLIESGIIPKGGGHSGTQREISGTLRKYGLIRKTRKEIDKNGRPQYWRFWCDKK